MIEATKSMLTTSQEKVEGKAKLGGTHRHAIEPYVMAQVLDFIYLGDYTTREPVIRYYLDPEEEPDTGSNRFFMSGPKGQNAKLEFHICMYLAAKRLMIEKLRVKAMRRVCDMLESDLDGFPGQQPSPEVLDFLLHEKNTAADDDLRFRVVNLCVNNPNLRVLPNIRYVLEKHEPVAYKLGLEFLQKIEEMF